MLSATDQQTTLTTANGAKLRSSCARPTDCHRSPCLPERAITRPATNFPRRDLRALLSLLAHYCLLLAPACRAKSNTPPAAQPASAVQRLAAAESKATPSRTIVDLVVLHATVVDEKGNFVPRFKQRQFPSVSKTKSSRRFPFSPSEDVPVTMGLVIDNSGSMSEKRPQVNAAALTFVKHQQSSKMKFSS